jgi:outer membrane protein
MKTILISVSLSVVLTVGIFLLLQRVTASKTGYIKSGIVLQEYKEMKDVSDQFNGELKLVQNNLDTLRKRYDRLKLMEGTISPKEQKDWLYRLEVAQNEYEKYNQQASQQMNSRKQELTKRVLETVNSFIQQYGKEHNYKLILGTTDDGSILYGNEADDMTQLLLEKLNEQYSKKQPGASTK